MQSRSDPRARTVRTQRDRCRYYLAHGVEEAWFVNFEDATIQVLDGKRDGLIFDEGLVASSSLPEFAVSSEALFAGGDDEWAPSAPLS